MRLSLILLLLTHSLLTSAQHAYWQQEIDYVMDINFDATNHRFTGKQHLTYTNHSPDTLHNVYYHLYFNAFQPGSMMDIRSQNIVDPDRRIMDRISLLKENEIGYHKIDRLRQNGKDVTFEVSETILKVELNQAILPGESCVFDMEFNSQVPMQIRRSGRNNIEGIDYSMSQWYPKMSEYDLEGWHANPYIAREYHGVWGNFEVRIEMDSSYTIAATGILSNPEEIGKGYGIKTKSAKKSKLKWIFKAENVHDFVWAADPDYLHTTAEVSNGTVLHFFYQNDSTIIENWKKLPIYAVLCFELMNDLVGEYPYPVYSIIQGGDGGMEYPMATLILGTGKLPGLVSVTVHESIHSWFQGVLANDEGAYPWLDEGFNTYFDNLVMDSLFHLKRKYPQLGNYKSYFKLLESGNYEAISIHADHYRTNKAYGVAAYSMGCILLSQLEYIVGSEVFERIIKRYYNTWKFKHPDPRAFKRIAEKESGMELDWYFNYFIETNRTINYGISEVQKNKNESNIILANKGGFPMPIDVLVKLKNGQSHYYTIPLSMMLKSKDLDKSVHYETMKSWPWTSPTYALTVPFPIKEIESIAIDPSLRLADVQPKDNVWPEIKED